MICNKKDYSDMRKDCENCPDKHKITHNGDKQKTYVDAYKKWENFVVK